MSREALTLCPACRRDWKPATDALCQSCRDAGRIDPNRPTVAEVLGWFVVALVIVCAMAWMLHKAGLLP